jgi:hypothetical protein
MVKAIKWRIKINEARELRKKGSELLYDRVALLAACYDDADFRQWHVDEGTNELDYLDEELSDVAATFLTMKAVLDANPNKEDWIRHNVRDLIALVLDSQKVPRERQVPSWKEKCLAAEKECERLRAELAIKDDLLEKAMFSNR